MVYMLCYVLYFRTLHPMGQILSQSDEHHLLFNLYEVYVYGKLRFCVRGYSEGKSEISKRVTNIGLAKTS